MSTDSGRRKAPPLRCPDCGEWAVVTTDTVWGDTYRCVDCRFSAVKGNEVPENQAKLERLYRANKSLRRDE